jgi:hypothetical protein
MLTRAIKPSVTIALMLGMACGDAASSVTATDADSGGPGSSGTAVGSSSDPPPTTDAPSTGNTVTTEPGTSTSGETTTGTTAGTTDDTDTTGDVPDPAAPLFAPGSLAKFDLVLSPDAIASLNKDHELYVSGDLTVTIAGQKTVLPDIGVRLKGVYGSFRTLDEKAAFLLNFDRYVTDQKLFDLTKLAVNNMVQDPSMQREHLGYILFRAGGTPAPRTGSAVVTVNGKPYGLYTTVESADNNTFLKTWFDGKDGNLYEGAYGTDLFPDSVTSFDQDNGKNVDFMDLKALVAGLDAITDPADFVAEASKLIDLDLFLTFAATEIYLGHWDGYAWTRNNYFIYRRESDLRWVFLPWGIDQTLNDPLDAFGGDGRIQQMCAASLECRMLLASKFTEVVARVDELGLATTAQTLADTLRAAAVADPRKEYPIEAVDGTVAANIAFLTNRGDSVKQSLLCTDPKAIDADKDGYSGCSEDCDDNNKAVHPGAVEVCDLDDDNCDGVWDNDPKCPQCVLKKLPAPAIGTAAFCFGARDWLAAEADCVKQKGHLISIHTQAVQDFLTTEAFAIQGGDWWIGLSDIKAEGTFVWTDGSKLDYLHWNGGEPNNAGEEDCANITQGGGGQWNDLPCDAVIPFICRLP